MTAAGLWVQGARPRTLPAALSPVLVGTGAAAAADAGARPGRALLALVVALGLQIGVNYANDYSDGIRGADDVRVGPLRLVGSGAASPRAVRTAALLSFAVASVAGVLLAALTSWWLIGVGAMALAAAWTYTGGRSPYGYRGLGEVSVFVFFGLVAVLGTCYVQAGRVTWLSAAGGVACGALACAILVVNNVRDRVGDAAVGKRTLAVRLGDSRSRQLYVALLALPFVLVLAAAPTRVGVLLALAAVPLAVAPVRTVRAGQEGPALIAVLQQTGRLQLAFSVALAAGLATPLG